MARIRGGGTLALILLGLVLGGAVVRVADADAPEPADPGLYIRPVLVLDPDMHTGVILRADVDAEGRYAVTGSDDKTVRVWSVTDRQLFRTIRLPAGPGDVGKVSAVAMSPDGALVAVGGFTTGSGQQEQIYLFRPTGELVGRIDGLPNTVLHLTFSPDGRHLAATLNGRDGLRVYARDTGWAEASRDTHYGAASFGADFSADGRLATTSLDGWVRLYDRSFELIATKKMTGRQPYGVAFSPGGTKLTIGYHDTPSRQSKAHRVDLLDGHKLALLPGPDTAGIDNGNLMTVAWSADGMTLFAGGTYDTNCVIIAPGAGCAGAGINPVVAWSDAGLGAPSELPAGTNSIMSLAPITDGSVLVATGDPYLALLDPEGRNRWVRKSPNADFRDQDNVLAVSADGSTVDFGYDPGGGTPARFDLATLALSLNPPDDGSTAPPKQHGLPIEPWKNTPPKLDGKWLLGGGERSLSLAVHPDGDRFVLGADRFLRAYDANGEELWRNAVPGVVWAANITGDGRLVVAAYSDGTIRWHRMDRGQELLAFMPLADRVNWVVWTPEGYYAASPNAHRLLRWHVNRDWNPAESYAVADIPGYYRPAVLRLVLQELQTLQAIGLAVDEEQRRKVQLLTRSSIPPGAQLHVLAIGISRYNEEYAKHLRLDYAHKDASDVVCALDGRALPRRGADREDVCKDQIGTQGTLYAQVTQQYLPDRDANRGGILRALSTLKLTGKDDLAVIYFSGHGAMVDGELYLLPFNVDARDTVGIKDTALPITAFKDELMRLAEHGRVLVLLDACYSGAASLDGKAATVDARLLSTALAAANISVLTSSSAIKTSREDPAWQNGAFTEALLQGLRGDADEDQDGLIGTTELARYINRRVRNLTHDSQSPSMEVRFDSTLFAIGR